jgi:hypothetical protein
VCSNPVWRTGLGFEQPVQTEATHDGWEGASLSGWGVRKALAPATNLASELRTLFCNSLHPRHEEPAIQQSGSLLRLAAK